MKQLLKLNEQSFAARQSFQRKHFATNDEPTYLLRL